MKTNETTPGTHVLVADTQHEAVTVINKEYVQILLIRLYNAIEDATGDVVVAVTVIEELTKGIESDPEFSKLVFTPENISKAIALKKKADAGTIKITDLEKSFPELVQKVPFWSLLKTFI